MKGFGLAGMQRISISSSSSKTSLLAISINREKTTSWYAHC